MELSKPIELLIVALLVSIIILIIIDFFQIRSLKIDLNNQETIPIDKYFELKWRINLLLSVTTVVSIVLGYLGFSIKSETSNELDMLSDRFEILSDSLSKKTESIDRINKDVIRILEKSNNANLKINHINESIRAIQQQNIQKWEFQIIEDVKTNITSKILTDTIYFSDLRTVEGKKLPEFKEIPLVNLIRNENVNWLFFHTLTTKKYFVVEQNGRVEQDFNISNIDIWILYK